MICIRKINTPCERSAALRFQTLAIPTSPQADHQDSRKQMPRNLRNGSQMAPNIKVNQALKTT